MKLFFLVSVFPLLVLSPNPIKNKELLKRFYDEVYVQWNMKTADELLSPDFLSHDWENDYKGAKGFRKYYAAFKNALPDAKYIIKDILADRDKVVVRWEMHATYTNSFPGINIPPTGQQITLKGIAIYRIENNLLAERWVVSDLYELINNLNNQH
ncbi:ester cyclase [Myroides indicus]|uniref:Steroid delta-isomerase-like uncharacterized protein n=1 Tax=Myroides indicus TaxID=1323422 RepID=A0A4R7EZG6_9FLAO|nr:ester cyclase [Myroides indicus]TDS61527.1 steroid delta-isomerase-like uncharacterized protein [Myroides indicus]